MKIGAHVSTSGALTNAFERAAAIGAEAMQIFLSSPRFWGMKPVPDDVGQEFRRLSEETGIGPTYLHGIYLVSICSPNEELLGKSVTALAKYMGGASAIGAGGVIFHCGSHGGEGFEAVFDRAVKSLEAVLRESPQDVQMVIENSAGMGNHIGSKFSEIGKIVKALDDPRVRVCLDTQHSFAAGYDLTQKDTLEAVMDEFDREIGVGKLAAVHCNDSKVDFGGAVDRHENIGEGKMGLEAFEVIMAHPAFRDVPFFLEVPGASKEAKGPDKENVDRLKRIRESLGLT
ncbi:MAG: deoxyribonuclease-4 [Chloroflexi bacterium]|jgi:deoxyribonuclease-4|nr:MAG: deoxyribonuclease-4 [Chloroflexota bacterium]